MENSCGKPLFIFAFFNYDGKSITGVALPYQKIIHITCLYTVHGAIKFVTFVERNSCMNTSTAWYREWFESPYYHLLYRHRDMDEAADFMNNLLAHLDPPQNARMLDAACGNGRHAIFLRNKGYQVTGIDLSERQINIAQQQEDAHLSFHVFDMRYPYRENHYDYVFNLFTSFGYFKSEKDNIQTLHAFYKELKQQGILILDFMNVKRAASEIQEKEHQSIGEVDFEIERQVTQNFIIKEITVFDKGQVYHFQERVQRLTLSDFKRYMKEVNFTINKKFGNYNLAPFDENDSERLILLAQKQNNGS